MYVCMMYVCMYVLMYVYLCRHSSVKAMRNQKISLHRYVLGDHDIIVFQRFSYEH